MTREDLEQAANDWFLADEPIDLAGFAVLQVNRALDEAAEQILEPWYYQKIKSLKIK